MAREHLSRSPFSLNATTWIYEEPSGIEVYRRTGRICVIPWSKVRAALARHDRPRTPRREGK